MASLTAICCMDCRFPIRIYTKIADQIVFVYIKGVNSEVGGKSGGGACLCQEHVTHLIKQVENQRIRVNVLLDEEKCGVMYGGSM